MREPGVDADRARWLLVVAAAAAVATVIALLAIDQPLARLLAGYEIDKRPWDLVIGIGEYAIGIEPWKWIGVIVLVVGVLVTRFVPRLHAYALSWLFVAMTHLICWNVMIWGKHISGRIRPMQWHGGATFWQHGGSFPSGHTMLFGSILLPLALIFPRARTACSIGVAFVMTARIAVSAHFFADVTCGLALTCLVTWLCWTWTRRLVASWPTPPASRQ